MTPPAYGPDRTLYREDEVRHAAGTVAVCPRTEDADALRRHGLVATAPLDDATAPDFSAIRGRSVVVAPTLGNSGERFREAITADLTGIAGSVRVVFAPVDEGEGIAEWVNDHGAAADDFIALARSAEAVETQPEPAAELPNVAELSTPEVIDLLSDPDPATREAASDELNARQSPAPDTGTDSAYPADILGTSFPPALDTSLLPPAIQGYVDEQSALTGCDPGILGLSCLVALASCVHDGHRVQPKRHDPTWTESARIWGAILGDPSTKKSPGLKHAMRGVKAIDRQWVQESAKRYAEWEEQAQAAKKDKTGETADPGERPPMRRLLLEDTTVEALALAMVDNPQGVLVHQDELSSWFGSMDAYNGAGKGAGKDRGHWLQAYNGGSRNIDRVLRGTQYVPNFSACVLGGIQPEPMRQIANKIGEDGLLQRFLIVCARPAELDEDRPPDMDTINGYSALCEHIATIEPADSSIRLSEAAHQHREENARKEKRFVAATTSAHMKAWVGKWSGLFARLCLLYHVVECARDRTHPASAEISGATAARVRHLIEYWLFPHAMHFYTEVVDSHQRVDNAQQIAGIIVAREWGHFTRRDLAQCWRRSRKLEPWQIQQAIETLEVASWITPDEQDLDTLRRPRRWIVNDRVHSIYREHAREQRRRMQENREVVAEMVQALKSDPPPTK